MALIDILTEKTLKIIGAEVFALFDNSFRTKSFNGKPWKPRQVDIKGTLMNNTGTLRRSLKWKVSGRRIEFVSNMPYAVIHNQGGKIKVTKKMQKFFWAKYRELTGKVKRKKNGDPMKSSLGVAKVANYFKALALKKVGTYIVIPQRQFVGHTPEVDKIANKQIDICIIQPLKAALARNITKK